MLSAKRFAAIMPVSGTPNFSCRTNPGVFVVFTAGTILIDDGREHAPAALATGLCLTFAGNQILPASDAPVRP
jgi:hypothetical protein